MIIILILAVVAVTALVAAVKFLPWWGSVLLVVGLVVAGKFTVKRLLKNLFLAPFKMKGAVLKGADAEFTNVEAVPAPASTTSPGPDAEVGDRAEETPMNRDGWNYFTVETTIVPQATRGKLIHWEPGELEFVPFDLDTVKLEDVDNDDTVVYRLEVKRDGQYVDWDGEKYAGPLGLRFTIAVKPGVTRLKLRYYFEGFGDLNLPAPLAEAA